MGMKRLNPVDRVPTRRFSAADLAFAESRDVTEQQLQAVHAQAVADGHGALPFIRLVVCARGGVNAKRGK